MDNRSYDLEGRVQDFGRSVVMLCKSLKQDAVSRPIISQLVRSSTSVGANYMEANGASSKLDFRNKIFICKKEARETEYWLKLVETSFDNKEDAIALLNECHELTLIFSKIGASTSKDR